MDKDRLQILQGFTLEFTKTLISINYVQDQEGIVRLLEPEELAKEAVQYAIAALEEIDKLRQRKFFIPKEEALQ